MSMLARVAGGLLSGVGDSIVTAAKQKREDALAAILRGQQVADRTEAENFQTNRDATQHGYNQSDAAAAADVRLKEIGITEGGANTRAALSERGATARAAMSEGGANARSAAALAASQGEIDHYITLDDGTNVGVTKTGKVVPLTDASGKPVKSQKDLTAADQRLLKAYETRHTTVDDVSGARTIDYNAVDADLRKAGRASLADQYMGIAPGGGTPAAVQAPANAPASVRARMGGDTAAPQVSGPSGGGSGAPARQPVPLPQNLSTEADGTIVADKAGNWFKKQGNLLVPVAKPAGK